MAQIILTYIFFPRTFFRTIHAITGTPTLTLPPGTFTSGGCKKTVSGSFSKINVSRKGMVISEDNRVVGFHLTRKLC